MNWLFALIRTFRPAAGRPGSPRQAQSNRVAGARTTRSGLVLAVVLVLLIPGVAGCWPQSQAPSATSTPSTHLPTPSPYPLPIPVPILPTHPAVTVLVADLEGSDPSRLAATSTILQRLRSAYPHMRVQPLHQAITARQANDRVRAAASRHSAAVLLWGMYRREGTAAAVTARVEVLGPRCTATLDPPPATPAPFTPLPASVIGQNPFGHFSAWSISPVELSHFSAQVKFPADVDYVTSLILGLARYKAQDYTHAIIHLNEAKQKRSSAVVHFYEGLAHLCRGNYPQAISAFGDTIRRASVSYAQETGTGASSTKGHATGLARYIFASYQPAISRLIPGMSKAEDPGKTLDVLAHHARSIAAYADGNYKLAYSDAKYVVDVLHANPSYLPHSNFADAYQLRGRAQQALGQHQKAIDDFNRALAITYKNNRRSLDGWEARTEYGSLFNDRAVVESAQNQTSAATTDKGYGSWLAEQRPGNPGGQGSEILNARIEQELDRVARAESSG